MATGATLKSILLGPISKNEVAAMVREHLGCSINSIRPIFGGGNNRLYQVTDSEGQRFAIKFLPGCLVGFETAPPSGGVCVSITEKA